MYSILKFIPRDEGEGVLPTSPVSYRMQLSGAGNHPLLYYHCLKIGTRGEAKQGYFFKGLVPNATFLGWEMRACIKEDFKFDIDWKIIAL